MRHLRPRKGARNPTTTTTTTTTTRKQEIILAMATATTTSSTPSSPSAGTTDVIIIGGGPGGLALGQILRHHGIEFRIFERDELIDPKRQGWSFALIE